jgi:hypothetical protein
MKSFEVVRGGEHQAPADRRVAAQNLDHCLEEGAQAELVTAEQPQRGEAEEALPHQALEQHLGIAAEFGMLGPLLAQ